MIDLNVLGNTRLKLIPLLRVLASNNMIMQLLPILILGIGITLSFFGYSTAFQRSGAVLVCVAIVGVYLNHFLVLEIETNEKVYGTMRQHGGIQERQTNTDEMERRYNYILKNNEVTDHKLAMENAVKSFLIEGKVVDKFKKIQPTLHILRSKIVFLEFLSGILGTLVWAFGDIPFLIPCCA